MNHYPTHKAVAFRLIYGPKWKCGQSPQRINLGARLIPNGFYCDQVEWAIRRKFPQATNFRLYDQTGDWVISGSL